MENKILDFLKKKQDYISGDHIAQRLGISRQALWKHIQALKDSGYDIEAVPHLGYKLISSPDRLFPSEISRHLNTKFIGEKIYYFDSVPSTMDIAQQLSMKGAAEGTLVLAETQTKGRGRLGREWNSPKCKGIYMSLILRPQIQPGLAPMLTLLSAVSVCEAIREIAGLDIQIKWPNDIVMHSKKLGGILTELSAEMDEVRFVIIGIGLNVNNDKKALLPSAASLKDIKKEEINRIELLQEILRRLETNYLIFQKKDSQPIIEKWRDYNITLGRRIKVLYHRKHIEAEAVDIDNDGGLLIRNDSGLIQKITAGDIVHCR
ncbi:MAG: biotin--[acetyl-CoA-carboxylase] ligase [Candidatus Omnitrophica bacterium]|nr:biotin--[acetyl-CoA-carboxylase] ligase [Candidatus Omnitrophota bacterium]